MELNKLLMAITTASAMTLAACGGSSSSSSSDDDTNGGTTPTPTTETGTFRASTSSLAAGDACATVGTFSGLDIMSNGVYVPYCELKNTISASVTLTTDFVYGLSGYITVGNGNGELEAYGDASNVTLTVNEGVQFRSTGRGSLVISRGSMLNANGTAANPIVMSSVDDGYDGQGEWGGLVVQGLATNNQCEAEYAASPEEVCNTDDEAGTGFHGGNDDADSSGTITYLIVAEGGYEVAPDSEVNGITLHSVGYGTTIENVMVYNNADDGIEFFGGAANVKNLILVDNGDESIDWDDGYHGNIQFALVRQGLVNEGDNGIEADNKGLSNTAEPISNPTLSNITFQTGAEGSDHIASFKDGTMGTLEKIAADNYGNAIRLDDAETMVTLSDILFEFSGSAMTVDSAASGSPNDQLDGWDNTQTTQTVELGNAFEVTGGSASVSASTATSANASTGFFVETDYIGAVDPTVTAAESAWWYWAASVVPAAFE